METSLKNLKVDSGTLRVKNSLRLQLLKKKPTLKDEPIRGCYV